MTMKFIRDEILGGKVTIGMLVNLGSPVTAEICGRAGFDWLWLDLEHGSGGYSELVHQIQAVQSGGSAVIVRIPWNEPWIYKRVLDIGASGVMVPYINNREEADLAARSMRYPPRGIRGVAKFNRACGYGDEFESYFRTADDGLLTVVQIESPEAVDNAEEIAAVDGVDVLFIGPLDLSVNLGIPEQYESPLFTGALDAVVRAAGKHGKAAGILVPGGHPPARYADMGYTFLAVGAEGGILSAGLKRLIAETSGLKRP